VHEKRDEYRMIRLKVSEVCKEKGISQRQLWIKTRIDINTIREILNNPYKNIETKTLDRIAKVLGVPAETLIESVPDEEI
jgi:DNA-binding Xre family transcriptional regulator